MANNSSGSAVPKKGAKKLLETVVRQRYLFLMSVPCLILVCVFSFGPMPGWLIAFRDYNPRFGILGSQWVGLKHFEKFFADASVMNAIRNTVVLSIMGIVANGTAPLLLALLINELRNGLFKRVIQTLSYLPHFVSMVIVGNIFLSFMSSTGPINELLLNLGIIKDPIGFLWNVNGYWITVTGIAAWKNLGWGTIIYLAAICAVDPELHDAAKVDGCKRFKRAWHITLPTVLPTCVILWVTSMAGIFGSSFDIAFIFGNPVNRQVSEVIASYIFRYGLQQGLYSFTTAINMMQTIIGFILVFITNKTADKLVGYSLW